MSLTRDERRLPKHRLEELRNECIEMLRTCRVFGHSKEWAAAWRNKLTWIEVKIAAAETRRGT